MATWADSMLEPPEDESDGESGMTIIPPAPEAVSVLPPPVEPIAPPVPAVAPEKKVTWRDFPLEDHVRAWMYPSIAPNTKLSLSKVGKNRYRANVYTPSGGGLVPEWSITASAHLEITLGDDGYIIVGEKADLTAKKKK